MAKAVNAKPAMPINRKGIATAIAVDGVLDFSSARED